MTGVQTCALPISAMEHMLSIRDQVFEANTWTRSRIMQKYTKAQILADHDFINIEAWEKRRTKAHADALRK